MVNAQLPDGMFNHILVSFKDTWLMILKALVPHQGRRLLHRFLLPLLLEWSPSPRVGQAQPLLSTPLGVSVVRTPFETTASHIHATLDAKQRCYGRLLKQPLGQTAIADANLPRVRPLTRLDPTRVRDFVQILDGRHFRCYLRECRFANEDHSTEQLDAHLNRHNEDVCYCSRWYVFPSML